MRTHERSTLRFGDDGRNTASPQLIPGTRWEEMQESGGSVGRSRLFFEFLLTNGLKLQQAVIFLP